MSALSDMAAAKSMRDMAKSIKDPIAKQKFEAAAIRLEKRAAKGVARIAKRKSKPKAQVMR